LICAGGTGGGVYPALAVHDALKATYPQAETLWVGGEGGMEARLVERAGLPFKAIPAAGLHGVGLLRLPGNLVAILRGILAAKKILAEFKPEAVFFTGGYVAVPMALAGLDLPSLLYVPDVEPGLALKTLSYFARRITVTTEDSRRFFPAKADVQVTGYPVRSELKHWRKALGRQRLGISDEKPVLLVVGGSKGARSINQAILEHLTMLLERFEIIHLTGELDWPTVEAARQQLSEASAKRYHAYPYLHEEMGAALSAADLAVSRAGASILGEFPLFGLPAILVPYPHAWRYQKVNAEMLTKRGAALMIEDAKLKSGLALTVEKLLETPEKLDTMRAAMTSLRAPEAANEIARHLPTKLPGTWSNWPEARMISLTFTFWLLVLIFGLIGVFRGWAKELLVSFSVILALAFNILIQTYVPGVSTLPAQDQTLFWIRSVIVLTLVFFGYQTVGLPRFATKAAREKLQDSLLGFVLGALNGYLIIGAIWFYMAEAQYPFGAYITAPEPGTAMGDAALAMIPYLSPHLLGVPAIYFVAMLAFIFVLVVFI